MTKTTQTTQTHTHTYSGDTGVLGRTTRALLAAMIRRGVTDYGITGLGAGYREDISDKSNMLRHRITCAAGQDDVDGIVADIAQAYADHQGCHLWACTAADPEAPTLDWTSDGGAPDAATAEGVLYLAIRCRDDITRGAALAVLERADIGGLVELNDSIILTPIVTGIDDLTAAAEAIDAIDTIVGGGVQMVPMCDYIDVTDPSGARTRGEVSGIEPLMRIRAMTDANQAWEDPMLAGIMDTQPVPDYCSEYGIKITTNYGGEAYKGYHRYKTKYGIVLQHAETMRISLSPAPGCRYDTWAQLYDVCTRQASDADRERTRELVEELRSGGREEEPDIITLDWAYDHRDDVPDVTYIPTGIRSYDDVWQGIGVGELTIVTGYSNHGKSTFLIQMMANMINDGRKIAIYGGENTWKEFCYEKMFDVFAGRDNVIKVLGERQDIHDPNARFRYLPKGDVGKRIRDWCAADRRLWLVNSDKNGHKPEKVMPMLQKIVRDHHADILIVDNLMKLGLTKQGADNNNKLTDYINALSCYAKAEQVAVVVVAHPTKDNKDVKKGKRLLTMDDIKGGSDVSQLADRVIMSYLNDPDFEAGFKMKFGVDAYKDLPKVDTAYKRMLLRHGGDAYEKFPAATGFLFVDKIRNMRPDRKLYLPVHYEEGSGRILSHPGEVYRYGWQDM